MDDLWGLAVFGIEVYENFFRVDGTGYLLFIGIVIAEIVWSSMKFLMCLSPWDDAADIDPIVSLCIFSRGLRVVVRAGRNFVRANLPLKHD